MRTHRSLIVAFTFLPVLASCEDGPARHAPSPEASSAGQPGPAPTIIAQPPAERPLGGMVDTLAGEWRVAGIDDTPLNETYGIALSASETELRWDPRCAQHARRYVIEGRSIAFTAGDADPAPCLSGQPATLAEVARALDSATTIERTPSNGIRIAGGGHSLLLFSQ